MRALAAEVRASGSSGPLFAEGLAIALVSRLAQLAGLAPDSVAPRGALALRSFALVKEKIESSLAETIRVADLAAVAGLSPAHFAREFRRITSEPPHTYVMRRRVERARELLLDGRSIAEVASVCGFADQAHLSRLFVRVFGIAPGGFVRREQRAGRR
jgi:AraC family transcriptional regulator